MTVRSFFSICFVLFMVLLFFTVEMPAASPFSQTQFTPDLSLILDCSFHWFGEKDKVIFGTQPFQLKPFSAPDLRTLQFNYLELAFSSVVDPYFDFFANLVFEDGVAEVEEAFVKTRFLPAGLSLKLGRFLSAFGRLNGLHEHQWSFDTAPLVYQQAFGDTLNENGIQLNWVFPADIYIMTGVEILLGENETSFNRGADPLDPGMGIVVAYAKSSLDFGNWVVLGGASLACGGHRWQDGEDADREGRSVVWGADLTVKYQIDSYRYLMLQGEYLGRTVASDDVLITDSRQNGLYIDLLYRASRRWRLGARFDWLQLPSPMHSELAQPLDLAAMVEFNPTEFSRIRLFYRQNRHQLWQGERFSAHQVGLSLNVAVGAHGAHSF